MALRQRSSSLLIRLELWLLVDGITNMMLGLLVYWRV